MAEPLDLFRRVPAPVGTLLLTAADRGLTGVYFEVHRHGPPTPEALLPEHDSPGRNPLSIIVPCHRVVGTDGSLTGFGGGLERKRWLLGHDAAWDIGAWSGGRYRGGNDPPTPEPDNTMKATCLALLAATVACTPAPSAPEPVALTLDRGSYAAGDEVTLTLSNSGAGQYYFNPCPRILEREEAAAWTPVDEGQRMCTMEAWILDPNGTRTATTELPGSLAAGRYRIVVSLTAEGQALPAEAVRAVSAPFSVGS